MKLRFPVKWLMHFRGSDFFPIKWPNRHVLGHVIEKTATILEPSGAVYRKTEHRWKWRSDLQSSHTGKCDLIRNGIHTAFSVGSLINWYKVRERKSWPVALCQDIMSVFKSVTSR